MIKRIGCLVLVLTLFLTGCVKTSSRTVMSIENQNSHSFSMKYSLFDGQKVYTIKADAAKLAVAIDIESKSGTLAITISQKGQDPVYTGNEIPTSSFVVYLNEPGTYTVTITAKEHSGSYRFDWEEQEEHYEL